MKKRILVSIGLLFTACMIPSYGQSKFNFNLGGGVSTPLIRPAHTPA